MNAIVRKGTKHDRNRPHGLPRLKQGQRWVLRTRGVKQHGVKGARWFILEDKK